MTLEETLEEYKDMHSGAPKYREFKSSSPDEEHEKWCELAINLKQKRNGRGKRRPIWNVRRKTERDLLGPQDEVFHD